MIRRVMIAAPFGQDVALDQLAERLDGVQLEPESGGQGPNLSIGFARTASSANIWNRAPGVGDRNARHSSWARRSQACKNRQTDRARAGSKWHRQILRVYGGWGPLPNFKNCLTSHKYDHSRRRTGYYRPAYLESLSAVHMRVTFREPFAGPLAIGAGRTLRFRGNGRFGRDAVQASVTAWSFGYRSAFVTSAKSSFEVTRTRL